MLMTEPWFLLSAAGAAGIVAAGGVTWLALFPFLPRDLGGAPNLDRRARRLRLPVDGGADHIDAWYVRGTRRAIVLVLHGYGRDHHRVWRYGTFLNGAGYGVLAIDFRSSRARGSGRRLPTTLGHNELPDAHAALTWISEQPELADHAVVTMGESLGGAVALMVAAESPGVDAVVADCAFASSQRAIEDSSARWARIPPRPAARLARAVGRAFTGRDPGVTDALSAARRLRDRPVFFIHSLEDLRVAPEQSRMLWEAAGSKDPLWLVADVGHNQAWNRHPDEYQRRVLEFLERNVSAPPLADAGDERAAIDGMPAIGAPALVSVNRSGA